MRGRRRRPFRWGRREALGLELTGTPDLRVVGGDLAASGAAAVGRGGGHPGPGPFTAELQIPMQDVEGTYPLTLPLLNPAVVAEKLAIVADARSKGPAAEDAAKLVGWSRVTLYRHRLAAGSRAAPEQA